MARVADLRLQGAGGEPVDFARTIVSHGVAELPPNRVDLAARVLETTLPIPRGARTVRITERGGKLRIETVAGSAVRQLTQTVAHMFRLDEDLSRFYERVHEDELAGVRSEPDACCARRRCSRTSSRRSERSYESSRDLLLRPTPSALVRRARGNGRRRGGTATPAPRGRATFEPGELDA